MTTFTFAEIMQNAFLGESMAIHQKIQVFTRYVTEEYNPPADQVQSMVQLLLDTTDAQKLKGFFDWYFANYLLPLFGTQGPYNPGIITNISELVAAVVKLQDEDISGVLFFAEGLKGETLDNAGPMEILRLEISYYPLYEATITIQNPPTSPTPLQTHRAYFLPFLLN